MTRLVSSLRKPNMSAKVSDIASRAYPRNKHMETPGQGCCCAAVEVWEAVMALSFQLRPIPNTAPTQQHHQGQQPWHTTLHLVQAASLLVETTTISDCEPPVESLLLLSQSCSLLRSKLFQDLQGSRPNISASLEDAASATDDQQVQSAQGRMERNLDTSSIADQQQQRGNMVSLQQQQQQQQQGECQQWEAQVQDALHGPWYLESLWASVHMEDQPLLASLVDCLLDFYLHDDMQQLPSQLQNTAAKGEADNTSCNSSSCSSRSSSSSQACCKGYREDNSSSSSRDDGMKANKFRGMGDEPDGDLASSSRSSSSNKPLSTLQNNTWSSSHQEASADTLGTPSLPPPGAAGAPLSAPSCMPSKQCKQTEGCVATSEPFSAPSSASKATAAAAGVTLPGKNAKQGPPSAGDPAPAHAEAACKQLLEGGVAAQLVAPWLLLQLAGAEGGGARVGPAQGFSAISANASLRVLLDIMPFMWGPEDAAKCSLRDKSAVCVDTSLRLTMLLLVLLQKSSVDNRVKLLQASPYSTALLSVCYELLRLPQVSAYSRQVKEAWSSPPYDLQGSKPGCIVRPGPLGAASMADGGKGLHQSAGKAIQGLGSAESGCSLVLLLLQHLLLEPTPGLVIGPEHIKQGAVLATGRGETICLWLGLSGS